MLREQSRLKRKSVIADLRAKMQQLRERCFASRTLQVLEDIPPHQLPLHREQIMDILESTSFNELEEEEHFCLVSDIFFLLLQEVIPPLPLFLKRNGEPFTAALVAYLSAEMPPQELTYWLPFMDEDARKVTFLGIDPLTESHEKWLTHPPLFQALLTNTRELEEAVLAFREILELSEAISRQQVVESIDPIHQSLVGSDREQYSFLKVPVLVVWVQLLAVLQRLREAPSRRGVMLSALQCELEKHPEFLLEEELLNATVTLNDNDPALLLLPEEQLVTTARLVLARRVQGIEDEDKTPYYHNLFLKSLYYQWRAHNLQDRNYRLPPHLIQLLPQIATPDNPFLLKLNKVHI